MGEWVRVGGSYLSSVLCAQFEVHSGPLVPCKGYSRGSLDNKEAPGVLYREWGVRVYLRGFPTYQGQLEEAGCPYKMENGIVRK